MHFIGAVAKRSHSRKVLQIAGILLIVFKAKSVSFVSKLLICKKNAELPKLHTRVRFPSPAPVLRKWSVHRSNRDNVNFCGQLGAILGPIATNRIISDNLEPLKRPNLKRAGLRAPP